MSKFQMFFYTCKTGIKRESPWYCQC